MDKEVKDRIVAINNKSIPEGYCRNKDIGIAPKDWRLGKLSDVLLLVKRAVPKPNKPYKKLGVRSWAKGTFCSLVDDPENIGMDEMYEVHEDDLVVNITFAWEHAIAIAKRDDHGLLVSHRFPTYEFKIGNVPNFFRAVVSREFFRKMLENISPGGAGRNRVLNKKDFLNLPCYIPPFEEQRNISEMLNYCDRLIKQCKEKKNEYINLKKVCLTKMFPKKGSCVPEIRFPGFTDDWEQRKFGDVFSGLQNNTLSRAEMSEQGIIKNIHYGDVLIKYGSCLDASSEEIPFIADSNSVEKYSASFLQDGDVIIADTAEDTTVGKCTEIQGSEGYKLLSGLHTIPCRPNEKYAPGYMGYYMNSAAYHDQLIPLMQGIKVTSISKGALQETDLIFPKEYEEQEKLGTYFKRLDHLITLHQREVEEYSLLKKAMTQLLLTGIVRVK